MSKSSRAIAVLVLVGAVAAVLALKNRSGEAEPATVVAETKKATVPVTKTVMPTNEAPRAAEEEPPVAALPRLVDLGAGKCIPCKMMAPILEELKTQYAKTFEVEFFDVWENAEAGQKYGIRMIPTQIFYDASGKELFRHEGFYGKEDILAKWREYGVTGANGEDRRTD